MNPLKLAISISVFSVAFATIGFGQEVPCDPKEHLMRDVISLDEDIETNLLLLDEFLQSQSKASNSSVSGSYAGFSLSGKDARNASAQMKKLLKLEYTERQKRTLFIAALSSKGVEAYALCLEKNKAHLSVAISEGAMKKREVLMTIKWHPQFSAPQTVPVGGIITGGQITEVLYENKLYRGLAELELRPQTSVILKIVRNNIFEPTEFAGAIEGHPFRIDIPAAPRLRLVNEIKQGTLAKYGPARETCASQPLVSCVELSNSDEGFLLPGSFQWKAPFTQVLVERTIANERTDESSLKICRSFDLGCPKLFGNFAHVEKSGSAIIVKAVPVRD